LAISLFVPDWRLDLIELCYFLRDYLAGVITKHGVSLARTSLTITKNGTVDAIERAEDDVLAGVIIHICIGLHFIKATIERINFAYNCILRFLRNGTLVVANLTQRNVSSTND